MTAIKALHHIWHNGERFIPGQVITKLDEETARQLVKGDAAFFVGQAGLLNPKESSVSPDAHSGETSDDEDPREVIEDNFTLEELKASAAEFKMKFPSNIKKQSLLDQIVSEGKEKSFLDLLED